MPTIDQLRTALDEANAAAQAKINEAMNLSGPAFDAALADSQRLTQQATKLSKAILEWNEGEFLKVVTALETMVVEERNAQSDILGRVGSLVDSARAEAGIGSESAPSAPASSSTPPPAVPASGTPSAPRAPVVAQPPTPPPAGPAESAPPSDNVSTGSDAASSPSSSDGEFLRLTAANWRAVFPGAPQDAIDAFVANADVLNAAGITKTRARLAYALANVEHECGGFTIRNLTENINYTAERMAEVWPNRFGSAADVRAKYGTGPDWRKKAFDDIYGNRMGNRPGTSDGSTYIGRGGPQITGRDGYQQIGDRCGLDLVNDPELATRPENQPAILAAFWKWKNLNQFADRGDFKGCVRAWNGGTNGMRDREEQLKGNDPVIERLTKVAGVMPSLDEV